MTVAHLELDTVPYHGNDRTERNRRYLRIWLGAVLFALFTLVLVGGATRLTDSGLSITQWKPIHGVIPPLSTAEWEEELQLYRQIPQYQEMNRGMSLDDFKYIFWWEWAHRLLARAIGLIFALPLAVFWVTGRVEKRLKLPLLGILALGGLQGFVGWWMVSSGLVERTDVSQYRLATHLMIACFIFASCVWIYRGLCPQYQDAPPTRHSKKVAILITVMTLFQVYLGALVAGLDAGFAYNEWPLIDNAIIPAGLFAHQPAWINVFENPLTVQFIHRLGAYALFGVVLAHMIASGRLAPKSTHAKSSVILFALVTIQAIIGIITLLLRVPVQWGVLHQGGALVVLAFAISHWRGFVGAYPHPDETLYKTLVR